MKPQVTKLIVGSIAAIIMATAIAGETEITIKNAQFGFTKWDTGDFVYSIGEISNGGAYEIDDIVIEVRYLDSEGSLVDATVERLYSISVPSADSVAFKIQSPAVAQRENYVSQELRVVKASDNKPCSSATASPTPTQSSKSNLGWVTKELLISSFPILLLIAVWIYFIRKSGGKNSPQNQTISLIEDQNKLMESQASSIDRIANAIEKSKKGG